MKLCLLLGVLSAALANAASIDVFYKQPPGSPPSRLARISFDPSTLAQSAVADPSFAAAVLDSFTPPEKNNGDEDEDEDEDGGGLVSVGLYVDGRWTSSLSAVSPLALSSSSLVLHLDRDSQPFHVDVAATGSSGGGGNSVNPPSHRVQVVQAARAVSPQLNAPVEVRQEEETEKTLFQRYWWLLPIAVLVLAGGGGGGEQR